MERRILVILGLVLLISSAAAIDLSPSTISSSNSGWLIANDGNDQSTITVYALAAGTPATPVTGAKVIFSLDPVSQDLGTISPVSPAFVLTGSDGKATAVFSTGKKTGNATIIATISYDTPTLPVQVVTYQRIDHDTPQGVTFENQAELPVGSITHVNVTLVDRWGNRIDNKNSAEQIRLTMADESGVGFQDGLNYVTQKLYSTDVEGNISAVLRISTTVKSNYIQMDPIGNIVVPPATYIQGVAESEPYYIAQTPASPGSTLPADGLPENAVEIYYTMTDKYNNPITGASVYCSSTDGMSVTAPTNTWGRLQISFGPKEKIGVYTLKAVPLGNTSAVCTGINAGSIGYCSQDVEYYNTDPVDLTFTGNPQSMTSLDVNPSTRSVLQARVIDIKGNPVSDELVTFSLADSIYPGGPFIVTTSPSLSTLLPVPVDGTSGYATVDFSPGAFAVYGDAGYNPAATGQVVATAMWTNKSGVPITRDVTLVWKNYPYISTSSLGDCGNSQVGDKINITILLVGDGAAIKPKPIDVLLLLDNSGSMGLSTDTGSRLSRSKTAAVNFIDKMVQGKDRVGVIFYDKNTYPSFSVYVPLTYDLSSAKNSISSYTRINANGYHTRTRYALYEGITLMKSWTTDRDSVRAIIHMTDGSWSMEGDPLARGNGFNLAFESSETDRTGLHSIWAGNVVGVIDKFRYFDDLGGGTAVTGTLSGVPNGQRCSNGKYHDEATCNGWSVQPEPYETTQNLTTKTLTYYTNAQTSNQNMSVYAASSKIRVYSIGFETPTTGEIPKVLSIISNSTGAYYQLASDSVALNDLYTKIAGDLQETAGGNTQVSLKYDTVKIDDLPGDITSYMEYVKDVHSPALPTDSTYYNKTHKTPTGTMTFLEDYPKSHDDGSLWLSKTMTFSPGEMKLNDTWSATFRLNLTHAGKIDLFGPGSSTISFTDAATGVTQTGFIPAMQCRVRESIVNTGFGSKTLLVDHLSFVEEAKPVLNAWTIQWNTTYDGDKTVQEAILYRVTGETQWKTIPGGLVFISTKVFEETKQHTISTSDTTLWPPGKCFDIQIVAGAEDANAAMTSPITKCKALPGGTIFIKLE
ncbi:MAG: VWA domain-containing protein [Methanoregula sp.]